MIEIVGPAGAGKSTIASALARQHRDILLASPPDPRSYRNLPFYTLNLLASLPMLIRLGPPRGRDGSLSRKPMAAMAVLRGWGGRIRRQKGEGGGLMVLDQGPVYMLADFHARGARELLSRTQWWDAMYARWAVVLDCVVWLDAADSVLMSRVLDREKAHRIKGMTDSEARRYLTRWRGSLGHVLGQLAHRSQELKIVHYDTSGSPPEELAHLILNELGRAPASFSVHRGDE